ncbi:hypothetical protein M409DRAFT_67159 [Zasmidium cellare ATCC 36951]|uniref:Protein kinase domain-containing protein n=1 Tax=Zasmidium cellare ATCC 36951 TaxID=1080233 RepID=A0A6A6CJF7_ZASCE|nr:uncharacterized protein M409DRAFT_67159 [Zasmidium cellare ATCC 36951]KAF2165839.1 hypothetical protein M409DRAFT_67159 [Zasmidium cellare ATCC 36951]
MARTVHPVQPPREHVAPQSPPTPYAARQHFVLRDSTVVCTLAGGGSEMLIVPSSYEDRNDIGEDADWRQAHNAADAHKCWKTTFIYQHIEDHPHLMNANSTPIHYRFIRPDPWTWLPVIANPGGPPLRTFLDVNRSEMYDTRTTLNQSTASGRVKARYKSLVYQWALQLATPIISIVFGDLTVDSCWLTSPGLSLSILGFLNSGFRTRDGPVHHGDILSGYPFNPIDHLPRTERIPTLKTDLFMWGCVVYELMTGFWPGEGQGIEDEEIAMLVPRHEWPTLESELLGNVVRTCWTGEMRSAAELVTTVRRVITELGAVIGDNGEVVHLDIEGLTI